MTLAGKPELLVKLPDCTAVLPAFELAAHVIDLLQAQGRPGPDGDAQCFAGSPAGLLDLPLANMDGGESGEETGADLGEASSCTRPVWKAALASSNRRRRT